MSLPTGTVTFLFTDIEGSTKLAQSLGDKWESLRARHHEILKSAIESNNGYVFQIIGDAFCASFHNAGDALQASIQSQIDLQNEKWKDASVKVRMGIHTGSAKLLENGDYRGYLTLSRVQRIMSAGHGEQVLISYATYNLLLNHLSHEITLKDMGERRLKDLIQPEHIYQLVIPGLHTEFPPIRTLDVYNHNLPAQTTTFIGRENEMTKLKDELIFHRLVTLTGSGGTGKTRLSLQVASEMLDRFDHGIWFIELAPITDPDLIPQTILSAIGIHEQQGKTPLDTLKEYLQERQLLIVLDNCEHLIEASARITEALLNAVLGLKILASSREALRVPGEFVYFVPSLSAPDPTILPDVDGLLKFEAVQLFVERVVLVSPNFVLDKNNYEFVAQICYRLDGIPLALELAAARINMFSVEEIAKRLDDRFRLLTGGVRTALPRQQTLRAMIDWSYNLLSEQEKSLFRRLAVFIGGWTLEETEEICGEGGTQKKQILDLLSQLVNKSLVTVETIQIETRYGVLETVRQYAREKLLDTEEASLIRDKHLDYFLNLAEKAEPELIQENQVLWLNKLEDELENFRAALEWSLLTDNGEYAMRIAGALGQFWWIHNNHLGEGREWIMRATRAGGSNITKSKALYWGSILARTQEDFLTARRLSDESLKLYRILDDQEGIVKTLGVKGSIDFLKHDYSAAQKNWDEALVLYRQLNDKQGIAKMLNNFGQLYFIQGDFKKAQSIYEECLTMYRELGNLFFISYIIGNLGDVIFAQGDYMRARELYEEALKITHEVGDRNSFAVGLSNLANVLYKEGKYVQSAQVQGAVISILKDLGTFFEPVEQTNFEKNAVALKEFMGKDQYEKEFEVGKALALEHAIMLALRKD